MFGSLGFPEILVILLLALMLFGPKRLPEIGRTLGKALGEFRRSTSDLKRSIQTEMTLEEMGAESPEKPRRPNVLRDSESAPPQTTPRQAATAPPAWGEPAAGDSPAVESAAVESPLAESPEGEPAPPVLTSFEPQPVPSTPAAEAAPAGQQAADTEAIPDRGLRPQVPPRDEGH